MHWKPKNPKSEIALHPLCITRTLIYPKLIFAVKYASYLRFDVIESIIVVGEDIQSSDRGKERRVAVVSVTKVIQESTAHDL